MRTLIIGLGLILLVGTTGVAHAQASDPNIPTNDPASNSWRLHQYEEYNEDDSHPVRVIAYALSPVGVLLEWTIARPLHYLATNTPLSAVLNPAGESWETDNGPSIQAPIIQPRAELDYDEQAPRTAGQSAEPGAVRPQSGPSTLPSAPPVTQQPTLH